MTSNITKVLIVVALLHTPMLMANPFHIPDPTKSQMEEDLREYNEGPDDVDEEVVGSASDAEEVVEGEMAVNDDTSLEDILIFAGKKSKGSKKKKCPCSSGCGMNKKGLKKKIALYVAAAGKQGISPISCIRTQACQDRLRRCFENKCKQFGRAAKKSSHSDGRACDFNRGDGAKLNSLRKKHGINRLVHGREGGGLHDYQ